MTQLEDQFDRNITSTEKNSITTVDPIQLLQEAKLPTTALATNTVYSGETGTLFRSKPA